MKSTRSSFIQFKIALNQLIHIALINNIQGIHWHLFSDVNCAWIVISRLMRNLSYPRTARAEKWLQALAVHLHFNTLIDFNENLRPSTM